MENNKTILLVQNQIEQYQLWKTGFFTQDCQVILTPSQAEVVEKIIGDFPVDLLLLDLNIGTFNPYIFCRSIIQKYPHLQVVLTDHNRQQMTWLEWEWASSQGAKDVVLGCSEPSQLSETFRRLFQILGWQNIYNEVAFADFLQTTQLKQKAIQQPIVESIYGGRFAIDRVFARNLCHEMYSSSELEIKDRRWRLRIFKKCFVGQEGVNWLYKHLKVTRPEAIKVGQELLKQGHIFHVLKEHDFKDGYFFYRFSMDGFPSKRVFS
ncbi:MAG: hypothetical protein QNJ38_05400 [Prochloraceae cyanobacterium]|nr:hypothetical protein [Prochloraceae cyanobacterium]